MPEKLQYHKHIISGTTTNRKFSTRSNDEARLCELCRNKHRGNNQEERKGKVEYRDGRYRGVWRRSGRRLCVEGPASAVGPQHSEPPWQPDQLQNKRCCRIQPGFRTTSRISSLVHWTKSENCCLGRLDPPRKGSTVPMCCTSSGPGETSCQPQQHSCGRDCRLDIGHRRRRGGRGAEREGKRGGKK